MQYESRYRNALVRAFEDLGKEETKVAVKSLTAALSNDPTDEYDAAQEGYRRARHVVLAALWDADAGLIEKEIPRDATGSPLVPLMAC